MKTLITLAGLALAALTTATATPAAEIWRDKDGVYIKGDIELGDEEKFKRIANSMPRGGFVVMKSAGGNLVAGLDIGIAIRFRQWRTVVVDECYSVCAFMWLAGVQRAAFSDSEIGFHGAYDTRDKTATSSGNAVVGAYLARLGFSYGLIIEMTSAKPDELSMLNFAKANSLGIKMTVLPTQRKQQPPPTQAAVPYVKDAAPFPTHNSDGTRRWPSQEYRATNSFEK